MLKFLTFLVSFVAAQTIQTLPNFYNINMSTPIEIDKTLIDKSELDQIMQVYEKLTFDQAQASVMAEEVLSRLGFEFKKINANPPFNYLLTKIPSGSILKAYLDLIISKNGSISLVFSEPLQSTISSATKNGIKLDPKRFLISLIEPIAVVPHETLHFIHMQEVKEGLFLPHNSFLENFEPLLATYKDGFILDEVEAHFGDAQLMKHRGKIKGESNLDHDGKAALVYLMLTEMKTAIASIKSDMAAFGENYLKASTALQQESDHFGFPVTWIAILYIKSDGKKSVLWAPTPISAEKFSITDLQNIIEAHELWTNEYFNKINETFHLNDLKKAQEVIKLQAEKLL